MDFNLYPGQSDLGQPALADAPGTARSFWDNLGGNMVEIDHGGGWKTWYAHLATVSISNPIDTGEQIGTVGNTTGSGSISPHLHYEQRLNNVAQPVAFDGQRIAVGTTYTANDPKVTSTNCGSVTPADGSFVSYNGDVFRIAGGAPIYVSSWDHVGGNPGNVRALSPSEFGALRQYPADGTFIVGLAPGDGEHGSVYRIAGGAPIYVSNWDHIGGNPGTTVGVDLFSIRNAGGGGVLDHLRLRPADGTFIVGLAPGDGEHGSVYRIAGGAPIYVSNWDHIGGNPGTTVGVDLFSIRNAGGNGVLDHLRLRPADGTFVRGLAPGHPEHASVYRIAGGAPIYVSNWDHIGGNPGTTVDIDLAAIHNAGNAGLWGHLLYRPADGTILNASSKTYLVSKGAPILQATDRKGTPVDPAAITNAGKAGVWSHLAAPPSATPTPTNPPATQTPKSTFVAVPQAVAKVWAAFPRKRVAVLNWPAASGATGYRVRVSKKNSTSRWHPWRAVTATKVTMRKLRKNGIYRVQIAATGPGGTSKVTTWRFRQKR